MKTIRTSAFCLLLLCLAGCSGCRGAFAGYSGTATKLPNGSKIIFNTTNEAQAFRAVSKNDPTVAGKVVQITRQPATLVTE